MKKSEAFAIAKRIDELLISRAKINDEIMELQNQLTDAGYITTQDNAAEIILHKCKVKTFTKPKAEISAVEGRLSVQVTKLSDTYLLRNKL